jgi:hypothetical protein
VRDRAEETASDIASTAPCRNGYAGHFFGLDRRGDDEAAEQALGDPNRARLNSSPRA